MIRLIYLVLFVLFFHLPSFSQQEKDSIETSISTFFDGISAIDADKLRTYATEDFILLEDGHVWNMDTLVSKLNGRKNSGIKRLNTFQFIRAEKDGAMAWVSYHNTAVFSLNEKQQTIKWLESAVLRRENGRWKIKMLHSTRILPDK